MTKPKLKVPWAWPPEQRSDERQDESAGWLDRPIALPPQPNGASNSPPRGYTDSVGFFWNHPPPTTGKPKTNPELERRIVEASKARQRRLMTRSLGDVKMRAIDWLWPGWIPRGYVTLCAGETGAGKSTVLTDIAARVTTGAAWPDRPNVPRPPGTVLWLASEDGIEDLTKPRLIACGADTNRVVEIMGVSEGGTRSTFSMQDDLAEVRKYLTTARGQGDGGVALLVIDPVTSYLSGQRLRKVDLSDAGQLRSVLEPWLLLAQEFDLAIVCVTHFMKDTARQMLHRVLGSAAFAQTCRSLCAVVSRLEDGPYEKTLIQVKTNLPDHPGGALKFATEKVTVAHDERNGRPIDATRPRWGELDPTITAESLGPSNIKPGPESKYASAFGIWLHAQFVGAGGIHLELPLEALKREALSIVSARWWDDHSKEYLEKENRAGSWVCRLKPLAPN